MNFRRTVIAPTPIMFNVTAFIDVLLVLCFFFLLTWSNRSKETDLTVALPQSSQSKTQQAPPAPMILNIRTNGDFTVNGRAVTVEEFTELASKLAKLNANQTVLIRADKSTPYDNVLRALDICYAQGITAVDFAASAPNSR